MLDEIFEALEQDTSFGQGNGQAADLSQSLEAELFLVAMKEECSPEEFNALVVESAIDLEIYKIIPDASLVTSAMESGYQKKVVTKQTKAMVMDKVKKRACIRLAEADDGPLWKRYKKGRTMMIEARNEIYAKYNSRGDKAAKAALKNSSKKAASMQTKKGNDIVAKMDNSIKKLNKDK